ncbi:MAG: hypothetical protein WEB09_07895 [Nitriliruptor sp.]
MTEQDRAFDLDAALSRFEDVLLALPLDRALPDLDVLLARADVPREVLYRDERACKVLHEAVLARPFADIDRVARVRTEVELLTLEVEVLTDRLDDEHAAAADVRRAAARLAEVRRRLEEIRGRL